MANPPGLLALAVEIERVIPNSALAGIEGDDSHTFGYHKEPNWLVRYGDYGANDASLQGPLNAGFNLSYASAIDISYWAQHSLNSIISNRMRAALKRRDPRLFYNGQWVIAEYAGTLNGSVTWAFYTNSMTEQFGAWDASHLDHNHMSIHRKFCNNYTALKGIAAVMADASATTDWFDMATKAELDAVVTARINERLHWWLPRFGITLRRGTTNKAFNSTNSGDFVDGLGIEGTVFHGDVAHDPTRVNDLDAIMAKLEAISTDVKMLKTKVGV